MTIIDLQLLGMECMDGSIIIVLPLSLVKHGNDETIEPERLFQESTRMNDYYNKAKEEKPLVRDPRSIYEWIRRRERRDYLAYSRQEIIEPRREVDSMWGSDPDFEIDRM